VFSDSPVDNGNVVSVDNNYFDSHAVISLLPNPTNGIIELSSMGKSAKDSFFVSILDVTGTTIDRFDWDGESKILDLTNYPAGLYFFDIRVNDRKEMFKVILH
jgi:hypothetical protein